jgi:curved DNA-binding protein CbpA
MSFKIDSGLFLFDFTDHHAVLGVPVDADFKDIRKRYLQIARRLHPDTSAAAGVTNKQWANELLSKLVNPAYEKFSHERNRAEYMVMLKEMSKRVSQEAGSIQLGSELSQQLKQSNNVDQLYKTTLHQLAQKQYQSFEQVLPLIAQISELNLVYLMRKASSTLHVPSQPPAAATSSNPKTTETPTQATQPESAVEHYLRRAQALIEKNIFAQARVELQEALKLEPNNSRCHSLVGVVYLKQNQTTMAKVHFNKALQLDPQDPVALKGKQVLDPLTQTASTQPTNSKKATGSRQSTQPKSGGMFGGMFGGKKK